MRGQPLEHRANRGHAQPDQRAAEGIDVVARSSWWTSLAWPDPTDPPFLNGVVVVRTALKPHALMAALDAMKEYPETLCHGDYRPDNLFFGTPVSGRPLVVCDWQSASRGPGVVDAAYFIAGSLSPDDRRAHEDELLRRYHNLLLEGGVKGYSLAQLKEDYRGYFAGVVAGAVVLLGTLPEGNERGRRLIEATVTRFLAAMEDHDSLALLPE